jgi:hypothetical protein
MRISNPIAGLAAAGLLAVTGLSLGAAAPAQAATSCPHPANGYMCVHVHNTDTGSWTWRGPWYACTTHSFKSEEQVTWVEDQQYTGTVSWFYGAEDSYLGSMTAKVNDRPPGYVDNDLSLIFKIQVC